MKVVDARTVEMAEHVGAARVRPGTEPIASQPTSLRLTVPRFMCTEPPIGLSTSDATMSLETAAAGVMPKKSTSTGVSSAPPPDAGESDHEADDQAGECDAEIEVHRPVPGS